MRPLSFVSVIVLGLVQIVSADAQGTNPPVPEPGTYRIRLCVEPCTAAEPARVVAVATLVILDDAMAAAEPARTTLAVLRSRWNARTAPVDNACFKVTQREPRIGTEELFLGITPTGASRWRYTAGEGFSIRVYFSPDATYEFRWTAPGALTRGEGWSAGPGPASSYHRNVYFDAARLGAPDVGQCQ